MKVSGLRRLGGQPAVSLGTYNHCLRRESGRREMEVARSAMHPSWKPADQGGNELNDVAVLTLRSRARGFAPASLPPAAPRPSLVEVLPQGSGSAPWEPEAAGREAQVAGFGEQREGDLSSLPCELHVATVRVLSRVACARSAVPDFYALQPSLLCAGRRAGGVDTCQGDSGGPLIVKENGKNILIGIVAFGYGCGQPKTPGLYTRVAWFLPWIREQMGQDNRILSGGSKSSSDHSSSAQEDHSVPQSASQSESSGAVGSSRPGPSLQSSVPQVTYNNNNGVGQQGVSGWYWPGNIYQSYNYPSSYPEMAQQYGYWNAWPSFWQNWWPWNNWQN